jgi:adenosine kinase
MLAYASYYQKRNLKYIFDPGQQVISFNKIEMKKMIKGAKMIIGNDYEIEIIKKRLSLNLSQLKKQVQTLIITKGDKGSVIYDNNKVYSIKAVKIKKLIDPTGAGDAYRAGLIKAISLNKEKIDWQKAGNLASLVASYAVAHLGTQTHKFNWTEIKKRYKVEFGKALI